MPTVHLFDYAISALMVCVYLISVTLAVRFGHMNWKAYCLMTYLSVKSSFFSTTWVACFNIISAMSLMSTLVYFEVYAFVVVVVLLFGITIITARLSKPRSMDDVGRG